MSAAEIIALSVAGVAAFFSAMSGFFMWRNGTPQVASDALGAYETRVRQLQEELNEEKERNRTELKELNAIVNQLKGQIQEKDNMITVLQSVLQGRNPEMQLFMQQGTEVFLQGKMFMETNGPIFAAIGQFFDKLQKGSYTVSTAGQ